MKILTNTRAVVSGLAVAGVATASIALGAAPAEAASTSVWDRVAACESGGNWGISTGNGYYGGLQFSLATWHGYGGVGNPADASKSAQIAIAEKVLAGQGWGAWPVCSVKAGATGSSSSADASTASTASRSASSESSKSARSYHSSSSSHAAHVASTRARAARHAAAPAHTSSSARAPRHAAVELSGKTYTVRAGDSLSTVAQRLNLAGGWKHLWAANPTVTNPNLIYTGQHLQLPA